MADRLGVFGSAFNPPHLAHLIFLGEARWQLELDRVMLVPTGNPYHKESDADPGPRTRLELARLAVEGLDGVEVSALEVDREGPSYTCDTLEVIAERHRDTEIHLLMGADAAAGFAGWREPRRILELAQVGIAERPGIAREQVETVFDGLDGGERIEFFEMPQVDISSSLIRQRSRAGRPIGHLVPTAVAEMIENEDTYGIE